MGLQPQRAGALGFLLVAEALSRGIICDKGLKGVSIDGTEYRITHFAGDTQLILTGYKYLKRMWSILAEYEAATGMLAKIRKSSRASDAEPS